MDYESRKFIKINHVRVLLLCVNNFFNIDIFQPFFNHKSTALVCQWLLICPTYTGSMLYLPCNFVMSIAETIRLLPRSSRHVRFILTSFFLCKRDTLESVVLGCWYGESAKRRSVIILVGHRLTVVGRSS